MISLTFNDKQFFKDVMNVVKYSQGFVEGVEGGTGSFLQEFAEHSKVAAEEYIDSSARLNPAQLQHVYEWDQNGSEGGRLFNVSAVVSGPSLTVSAVFKQSTSVKSGSKEPFANKAKMMEEGTPVTISPKTAKVLSFDDNGETIFTKKSIRVEDPGGVQAQGGFEKTFNEFFNVFFSQSFLKSGKLEGYLAMAKDYHDNFAAAKTGGRSLGKSTGYKWITKAGRLA
jgi:hypothetical protein